jgi:arylsulfatase A-like enzyme
MARLERRAFLKQALLSGSYALIGPAGHSLAFAQAARRRHNVLFFAIDDLRSQLGCYGTPGMVTPHIDRLGQQGTVFLRSYCQQSICNPSRASLLTGLRPDTTRIHDLSTHFRMHTPDAITLPQYFKQHGYHTQGLSKIFHGGLDDPQSWSAPQWRPEAPTYIDEKIVAELEADTKAALARGQNVERTPPLRDPKTGIVLKLGSRTAVHGPAWESADCPDSALADGKTAEKAVALLREYKGGQQPFFLAVGFIRPHLPFVAPKKYFDLYPAETIQLPPNHRAPDGGPRVAFPRPEEPRAYKDVPKDGPIPDARQRELIRAYRACVSYVDAMVGQVVDELDRLGLRDRTVISLFGDHGWHLGENAVWGKMTNFEAGTLAPLIVSAPGQSHPGARTTALAEFVDLYPTLCELCGLPVPAALEGTSLVPLMENPRRAWKTAAFSQEHSRREGAIGYSLRTDRYRYTEWYSKDRAPVVARELYDHHQDPGETINLAAQPGHEQLIESLGARLRAGWKAARPQ